VIVNTGLWGDEVWILLVRSLSIRGRAVLEHPSLPPEMTSFFFSFNGQHQ